MLRTSGFVALLASFAIACHGGRDDDSSAAASAASSESEDACTTPADGIFVAPAGDDTAAGTRAAPLRTVQAAVQRAAPGSTVVVAAGRYPERVVVARWGWAGEPITLRSECGARPILDGAGKGAGLTFPALIGIEDRSHIVVSGFTLANLTGVGDNFPSAVWIRGSSTNITIKGNVVQAIKAADGGREQGAHGIAVYGTKDSPAESITLEGNELSNLVLGPSEALVLNGNVRRFVVRKNSVHDSNNIAYDFIGYEKTCASCRSDDLDATAVDRVRDGVVSENVAFNITSRGNPAYGQDRSAGCFYVDGGGRITIEQNTAHACDLGVELASEHAGKATSEIVVRNNFLYENFVTGIATGGYDAGSGPGGGRAERCAIVHNTIVDSSRDSWAKTGLLLQNRNVGNIYVNNIIVASAGSSALGVAGSLNQNNAVHHNLYVGAVNGVAPGEGSLTSAPAFVAARDVHLTADSPAVGRGAPLAAALAGQTDIDGDARGRDIGADQRTE